MTDNDRIVEIGARALSPSAFDNVTNFHTAVRDRTRAYAKVQAVLTAFEEAGLVVERGWQPISTAPKDGRGVLVSRRPKATSASGRHYARRVWGRVCPARWVGNHWRLMLAGQYARDCDLDGWRPLSAPPAAKADPQ